MKAGQLTSGHLEKENARSRRGLPLYPGSPEHLQAFCRMLLDTHDPYKPAVIAWPKLDAEAESRLKSLPIWDIAVQTEGKASRRVKSYAAGISHPLLKDAVELNAFEEARHKIVLANLVEAYGIVLEAEPPYPEPRDAEWAFLVTGYSECIDSFSHSACSPWPDSRGIFLPNWWRPSNR